MKNTEKYIKWWRVHTSGGNRTEWGETLVSVNEKCFSPTDNYAVSNRKQFAGPVEITDQ